MKIFNILLLLILVHCTVQKEEIRLGANWSKISETLPARRNFGAVVLDGKIIVIGGYIWKESREELGNDVWISEDEGQTWKEIKTNTTSPTATFTKRQKFATLVLGQEIYIIGGYSDTGSHLNDVWKSSDFGKTWIEIVKQAEFSPRYGHKAVVLNDEIYVIGGYDGRLYYNDVWKSNDQGKTWSKEQNIPFKERQGFGLINYKGEILLLGGQGKEILTDLWKTDNKGQIWYKEPNVPFEFFEHEIVEIAGDLFVVEQDHVWKSIDDGKEWNKILFNAPFIERTGYGLVNIGKKLILFGGIDNLTKKYLNDVWISEY